MATGVINNPEPDRSESLKQVFESAVGELDEDKSSRRKSPICPRQNGIRQAAPQDQNRALNDAAEALAALWKTSPSQSAARLNRRRQDHK